MPRKVPFKVLYASSEDEKFRASELDQHGPTVKGWQSHRSCQYPQEIIFRLAYPVSLTQVQVLAHQYLIPRKLELWIGPEEHEDLDVSELSFDYVGYITLSDNEKSSYKSRELKSISVPACKPSAYVRLSLDANHENQLNKHNQVGPRHYLLSGQAFAHHTMCESLARQKIMTRSNPEKESVNKVSLVAVQLLGERKGCTTEASAFDDLSFEMYVDLEVASIIRRMERKKEEAVKCERFRYAGKLKAAMAGLREVGERLGRYEVSKQQAIASEDYTRANRKKEQIDVLRTEAYQTLGVKELLEENGMSAGNDCEIGSGEDLQVDGEPGQIPDNIPPPGLYQSPLSPLRYTSPTPSKPSPTIVHPVRTGSLRRKKQQRTSYDQYDDRLIASAHRSHLQEERPTPQSQLPKMNEREKKQAALPISVFGIQLVEKFYSRQYSDKEEGVKLLENLLKSGTVEGNKIARAAVFLLHRALRDKVFSVYSQAAQVVEYFFSSFISNRVSTSEVARSVEKLLPELLSKSGDVTPRIHNTAVHTILSMAHAPDLRKINLIPVHITRPLTSASHPRLALSKLEIVEQLIPSLGISTDKNSGMTARVLAEFGASALHHPAEAVRKVAERVLVLVYRVNPRMVRKQLPPDDDITRRNLLYRHLLKEFDKIDSEMASRGDKEPPTKEADSTKRRPRSGSVSETNKTNQEENQNGRRLRNSASCYNANRVQSPVSSPQHTDKQCIFCYRISEKFTEEGLNIHYWRYCPMLTRCLDCGEVVEIPSLASHVDSGCEKSGHRETGAETKCPFCKSDLENTDSGWRKHLVEGKVCPSHPRAAYINRGTPPLTDSYD